MPENYLYEYAVIRLVPKVEREEFINIGIVLFSKQARFIKMLYRIDENKLRLFSTELDSDTVQAALRSFEKICKGEKDGGPIAALEIAERFRWLTAVRSSCLQTSRPHSGFSPDLDATAEKLFRELVW